MKRSILILVSLLLLHGASLACTSAIVAAHRSSEGVPLLWKHRDNGKFPNTRIDYIADGTYAYSAIVPNNEKYARGVYAGVNEKGFGVISTATKNLPESTPESEQYTAELLCELGVDAVRIYPTVVFFDTELCDMAKCGEYTPIDNDNAVMRTKELLKIFDREGVECIRVGLCASENLSSADAVYGGANHSAIGELAMGEFYFDKMCEAVEKNGGADGKKVIFLTFNSNKKAPIQ